MVSFKVNCQITVIVYFKSISVALEFCENNYKIASLTIILFAFFVNEKERW